MSIVSRIKVYIRSNDLEKSAKERKQQIETVVQLVLKDKTAKQSIEYYNNLTEEFNKELLKVLKQSNENVEAITKYINTNKPNERDN